jgi:hypothetical protein
MIRDRKSFTCIYIFIFSLKENKRPNSLLNGGGNTSTDAFGLGSGLFLLFKQ